MIHCSSDSNAFYFHVVQSYVTKKLHMGALCVHGIEGCELLQLKSVHNLSPLLNVI